MKKRVIRKKKIIKNCGKRKYMRRALSLAASICLLAGMALSAHGEGAKEADEQVSKVVITEIYHKHSGNSGEMGGCYSVPIIHQHQGSEEIGGPCYQTPVYHIHEGNDGEGGGCYTQPVYHQHNGDELKGGECYEEITHVHTQECYQQEDCVMNHTPVGEVLETWTGYCYIHQETTFGKTLGIASHSSCGKEDEENYYGYCLACGFIAPTVHSYQKLICQIEEGTATGYQLSCGKDENTIDGYTTDCGFEESEIEAYALSCEKTVDGYLIGCGFEENQLCGRMIVTNEVTGQAEQVELSVRLEDLTGGILKPGTPAYEWRDENGQLLGTGNRIAVNKNGRYSVLLMLENKDVDEAGLCSSILVDNIYELQPEETPSSKATPATGENAQPSPSSVAAEEGNGGEENTATPVPQADIIPEDTDNMKGDEQEAMSAGGAGKSSGQAQASVSPSPAKPPVIKEIQTVKPEENEAQEEISYSVEKEKKHTGFFDAPAVRIIAVTGSAFLLAGGLLLLLFYLRHSVSIFNDDGEGRLIRLGRCMVRLEEECYAITITEAMVERAYTNRYCIKPGLFLLGKKEGQELIVYQDAKGVTVYLSRKIIVMM